VYDYPRTHRSLGLLSPNPDHVAMAIAASTGNRLQASGARAANLLGLTTQVPAQLIYLTDGRPRKVKIGTQVLQLKHTMASKMPGAGSKAGLALQAIRAVGPKADVDLLYGQLSTKLSNEEQNDLIKLRKFAPSWSQHLIERLKDNVSGRKKPANG